MSDTPKGTAGNSLPPVHMVAHSSKDPCNQGVHTVHTSTLTARASVFNQGLQARFVDIWEYGLIQHDKSVPAIIVDNKIM